MQKKDYNSMKNIVTSILEQLQKATSKWKELFEISFLSDKMKEKYLDLLENRVDMYK